MEKAKLVLQRTTTSFPLSFFPSASLLIDPSEVLENSSKGEIQVHAPVFWRIQAWEIVYSYHLYLRLESDL